MQIQLCAGKVAGFAVKRGRATVEKITKGGEVTAFTSTCLDSPVSRGPTWGLGGGGPTAENQGDGLCADLNGPAVEGHGVVLDFQGVAVADN